MIPIHIGFGVVMLRLSAFNAEVLAVMVSFSAFSYPTRAKIKQAVSGKMKIIY